MRDGTRRVWTSLVQIVGLFALALLAAGCGSEVNSYSSESPGGAAESSAPASGQALFRVDLLADDHSLDQGILGYQAPATMNTGTNAILNVEVIDNGNGGGGTEPLPSGTGYVFARQDVPTGGIVGLSASCQGIACSADGPATQPVLSGMTGNWSWELSAQHPGTARVLLVATTYDQGTDIPLHVTSPIEITITINATPGYWASTLGNWSKGVIGFIGVGTLASGITWLMQRDVKRRSSTPSEPKEPAQPASGP